MHRLICLSSF
jgi:fragile X mental retardation protein